LGAEHSARACKDLSGYAMDLRDLAARFKLD